MGLFDQLKEKISGGGAAALMPAIIGMISNQPGGVQGILEKLKAAGLQDQVTSWLGNGPNQPVSADAMQVALGHEQIAQVAQAAGVSHDEAAQAVAHHLPTIIDKLSPNGTLAPGDFKTQAMNLMRQFGH